MDYDWKIVEALKPAGCVCLENRHRIIRGPLESLVLTWDGNLELWVKWAARKKINPDRTTVGVWEGISNRRICIFTHPSKSVSFKIEDVSARVKRVRFAEQNFIYVTDTPGIVPENIIGWP